MGDSNRSQTTCPHCGKVLNATDELSGGPVKCPHCHNDVDGVVPTKLFEPELSPPPTQKIDTPTVHAATVRSTAASRKRGSGGKTGVVLGGLALVVSLATLALVVFRNPVSDPLSNYDFTTARAAMDSHIKMAAQGDLFAVLALKGVRDGTFKELRDMGKTTKVYKEADFQDKKIMFISSKVNGDLKFDTPAFEKDPETELWMPTRLTSNEVWKHDKELADEMTKWQAKSQ